MTTLHGIEVKVGDPVWDSLRGWNEVYEINEDEDYQIATGANCYTKDGFLYKSDELPRLFWQEFELTIPAHAFEKPKVKVKAYIVLYRYNGNYQTTSHWDDNYYSGKEDFVNKNPTRKFISLILESEIEVEE